MNPFKLAKILNLKRKLEPVTFFEQLAQDGMLEEYIDSFLLERFHTDLVFRDQMLELLYKYSNTSIPEIEELYLLNLVESLSYFLEYTKPWRIQEP